MVEGIRVVRVWTFMAANRGLFLRTLNYISYLKMAVVAGVFQRRVDIIVATSPQFFCGWAGVMVHWIRRWPFVLEVRDIWPESILAVGALKRSPAIKMLEKLERIMYRVPAHIIAVGEGYKKKIVEKGIPEPKVSVIINGVDMERFPEDVNGEQVRGQYGAQGKFVCSYAGTVGMAHGLEVVLEAAEKAAKSLPDVVFWIIGDGAHKQELEKKAREKGLGNVVFTGLLPKEKMPVMMAASDACLVHLKGREFFQTVIPSKIFEFMAMKVPVVMGVRGEALEVVLKAGAGVEMRPDDPDSLLECIHQIRERGRGDFKGRDYVAEHFNRDKLARDMLAVVLEYAE
jgi:glycosyltransferase involved in cell wall biosynthesis